MGNITSTDDIKIAIQLLEAEQTEKLQLLKDQLYITYESMKPVNLIKSTLKEISTSPYLVENILGAVTSLATGFVSRKLVIGTSGNLLKRVLGAVLQFGVTNLVANHTTGIKSLGQSLFQRIFHRKDVNPGKP